ncbi:ligase-associated DNA damage response endonuclease PdeM [Rhodobacterales bacterium HKCCE2091]|nr:ligase-associated DNA damage response endonuclease PdeM [Rhodobacterales bacterium HKCCE2091]
MNAHAFDLSGERLELLPSGALHWPRRELLCVSDLHLGKSERIARRGGGLLPPYETRETLLKLEADISLTAPATVVCLGDSFDDLAAAAALDDEALDRLAILAAGRRWIWIEGNHDTGPVAVPGIHLSTYYDPPLIFRHIAENGIHGEISGHYHPKARVRTRGGTITRRCALTDGIKTILPAYGAFTGGLPCDDVALADLMGDRAVAILLADPPLPIPMPRPAPRRGAAQSPSRSRGRASS